MIQSLYVPYLLGLGGRIGKGDQWFPWIHVKDVAGLVTYAIMHDHVSGILNGVAPEAVTSAEFARIFGRVLRRPSVVPVPGFVMKAVFGRERSHVVLDGQKVIPKRTLETGYPFSYPCLVSACQDFR
ncbi:hypothetical protein BaRGS_00030376 [Batillaria attramentaria]|uniref:DUF1731 domain-containing protein n=1 Tax=Batillaria attramentaria TaxID=370345 RepID=A0ABD0JTM3_9CAEN